MSRVNVENVSKSNATEKGQWIDRAPREEARALRLEANANINGALLFRFRKQYPLELTTSSPTNCAADVRRSMNLSSTTYTGGKWDFALESGNGSRFSFYLHIHLKFIHVSSSSSSHCRWFLLKALVETNHMTTMNNGYGSRLWGVYEHFTRWSRGNASRELLSRVEPPVSALNLIHLISLYFCLQSFLVGKMARGSSHYK